MRKAPLTPPSSQGGPLQLTINRAAAPRRRARRALIYGGWLAGDVLPRAFGATTEPRKEGPLFLPEPTRAPRAPLLTSALSQRAGRPEALPTNTLSHRRSEGSDQCVSGPVV